MKAFVIRRGVSTTIYTVPHSFQSTRTFPLLLIAQGKHYRFSFKRNYGYNIMHTTRRLKLKQISYSLQCRSRVLANKKFTRISILHRHISFSSIPYHFPRLFHQTNIIPRIVPSKSPNFLDLPKYLDTLGPSANEDNEKRNRIFETFEGPTPKKQKTNQPSQWRTRSATATATVARRGEF